MLMDENDLNQDNSEEEEEHDEEDGLEDQNLGNGAGNILQVGRFLIREEPMNDPIIMQRLNQFKHEKCWGCAPPSDGGCWGCEAPKPPVTRAKVRDQ